MQYDQYPHAPTYSKLSLSQHRIHFQGQPLSKMPKCHKCKTEDTTKERKLTCKCTYPLCDVDANDTVNCEKRSWFQRHGQCGVTTSQCERCPKGTLKDTTWTRDMVDGNSCVLCYECAKGSGEWLVYCKGKDREVLPKHQK